MNMSSVPRGLGFRVSGLGFRGFALRVAEGSLSEVFQCTRHPAAPHFSHKMILSTVKGVDADPHRLLLMTGLEVYGRLIL